MNERQQAKQDELLEIRASLGRWQLGTTYVVITERDVDPMMDSKGYRVSESRKPFQPEIGFNSTARDVKAKIKAMQQMGYKLTMPQFPELQAFFRNGRPITEMDIFEDGINEIKAEKDERTGLEFLLETY